MKKRVWYNPDADYIGATGVGSVAGMAQLILHAEEVLAAFDFDPDVEPTSGDVIRVLDEIGVSAVAVPVAYLARERWDGSHVHPVRMSAVSEPTRLATVIEYAERLRDAIPYPPPESADTADIAAQAVALEVLRLARTETVAGSHPSACPATREPVTDEMADAANRAWHEFVWGPGEPLSERDLGVTRQAWRAAIQAAFDIREKGEA